MFRAKLVIGALCAALLMAGIAVNLAQSAHAAEPISWDGTGLLLPSIGV